MRSPLYRLSLLVFGVLAAVGTRVSAHHSFTMFDQAAPITITGVVSSVEWTNPHVYIELDLIEPMKGAKHWSIELGSPSILQRGGWKFNSVKRGDKVTAVVSPLKNGEPGSLLTRITLPDGRVLGNGGPAGVGPGTTEPAPPARGATSPAPPPSANAPAGQGR
jgi:hypothetical protein